MIAPLDPLIAERYCQLFPHRFHWIIKRENWTTETRYPLSDKDLLKYWQSDSGFIGVRFGKTTQYCLIDIDEDSPYHPNNGGDLKQITNCLEDIGLVRPIFIRSSHTEGIHIYYFLPEKTPTFKLACLLYNTLIKAGLDIAQGTLETFPNMKRWSPGAPVDYNGHRLPLQQGSYILDADLNPVHRRLSSFLSLVEQTANAQDWQLFVKSLNKTRRSQSPRLSGKASDWKKALEDRIAKGWSGLHQTNELLADILRMGRIFLGKVGVDLLQYMILTARSCPGFDQWCRHKDDLEERCKAWIECCERHQYYTAYGNPLQRDTNYDETFQPAKVNDDRSIAAIDRIKRAVTWLKEKGFWPQGVTQQLKAIKTTVQKIFGLTPSTGTLYKHSQLWKEEAAAVKEERCGTNHTATVSANQSEETSTEQKDPEQRKTGLFHTPPYMKVGAGDPCDKENLSSDLKSPKSDPLEISQAYHPIGGDPLPPARTTLAQRHLEAQKKVKEIQERIKAKYGTNSQQPAPAPEPKPEPQAAEKPSTESNQGGSLFRSKDGKVGRAVKSFTWGWLLDCGDYVAREELRQGLWSMG